MLETGRRHLREHFEASERVADTLREHFERRGVDLLTR
jgi:hypothetical protein